MSVRLMEHCAILTLVVFVTWTKAAEIIECRTSGTIESSRLNPQMTYHYTFPSHPSDNTLLMFNVTTVTNVKAKRLKFYRDAVALDEGKCTVFFRPGNDLCSALWIKAYPSCMSETGSYRSDTHAITVTKIKRNQQLTVDYKIVYCDSGEIITPTEGPIPTNVAITGDTISSAGFQDKVIQITSTPENYSPSDAGVGSPSSEPIQWSLILAIAMSSAALGAMVIAAIACACRKKRKSGAARKKEKLPEVTESEYMQPTPMYGEEEIYEEIDEPYDELGRNRASTEPQFHRFQMS